MAKKALLCGLLVLSLFASAVFQAVNGGSLLATGGVLELGPSSYPSLITAPFPFKEGACPTPLIQCNGVCQNSTSPFTRGSCNAKVEEGQLCTPVEASQTVAPQDWLNAHNRWRRNLRVDDKFACLQEYVWNSDVADKAQKWADILASSTAGCAIHHGDTDGNGQNIAYFDTLSGYAKNVAAVVETWADERFFYNMSTGICRGNKPEFCAHYIQLVSDRTVSVGCGMGYGNKFQVAVCNYKENGVFVSPDGTIRPFTLKDSCRKCAKGFADCGDGRGCVSLNTVDNCGSCGSTCDPTAQGCRNGSCYELFCNPGLRDCGSGCQDVSSDIFNCGDCKRACGENQNCVDSTCVAASGTVCLPGTVPCGGQCSDLITDAANCGVCGFSCLSGPCEDGICIEDNPIIRLVRRADGGQPFVLGQSVTDNQFDICLIQQGGQGGYDNQPVSVMPCYTQDGKSQQDTCLNQDNQGLVFQYQRAAKHLSVYGLPGSDGEEDWNPLCLAVNPATLKVVLITCMTGVNGSDIWEFDATYGMSSKITSGYQIAGKPGQLHLQSQAGVAYGGAIIDFDDTALWTVLRPERKLLLENCVPTPYRNYIVNPGLGDGISGGTFDAKPNIPGWLAEGDVSYYPEQGVAEGSNGYVHLSGPTQKGTLTQSFVTKIDQLYALDFWLAAKADGGPPIKTVRVTIQNVKSSSSDSQTCGVPTPSCFSTPVSQSSDLNWHLVNYATKFRASANTTLITFTGLDYRFLNSNYTGSVYIDEIKVYEADKCRAATSGCTYALDMSRDWVGRYGRRFSRPQSQGGGLCAAIRAGASSSKRPGYKWLPGARAASCLSIRTSVPSCGGQCFGKTLFKKPCNIYRDRDCKDYFRPGQPVTTVCNWCCANNAGDRYNCCYKPCIDDANGRRISLPSGCGS